MDCSTPGFPVPQYLPEFTQTHVHWVSDIIQPSHPLSSPFSPALNLSQLQGLLGFWKCNYFCFNTRRSQKKKKKEEEAKFLYSRQHQLHHQEVFKKSELKACVEVAPVLAFCETSRPTQADSHSLLISEVLSRQDSLIVEPFIRVFHVYYHTGILHFLDLFYPQQ